MIVVHSARYHIDIGPHVFPTAKYQLVLARLLDAGTVMPADIVEPEPATWEELAVVHTSEYLTRMREGTMTALEIAELELPWSRTMVDAFRLMVGGTIDAACMACGVARSASGLRPNRAQLVSHLGGGLHHAFANHGEGFCPFNDVAIAARILAARGVDRLAIIDLDVHHGNGTAFIFNPGGAQPPTPLPGDVRVFTFSMHQQHNYPMFKPRGSLDVGLPDGADDEMFLSALDGALPKVMETDPRCVFYLAGADPYEDDQLGGLRLTREGLRRRDRLVIDTVCAKGIPLVVTLAGGYARRVEDTVAIHAATIEEIAAAAARIKST